MSSESYIATAKKIIKESIKSAIYIDDEAQEPFDSSEENQITKNLYDNFKNKGISLSVYRYDKNKYEEDKDYIFQNRDLLLLDWELEEVSDSGEKALELLEEIVYCQQHIPFCVIYTKENKEKVLNNIISFFSGSTKDEYDEIKQILADKQKEIEIICEDLIDLAKNFFDREKRREILHSRIKPEFIKDIRENLKDKIKCENDICYLIKTGIAFSNFCKSKKKESGLSYISQTKNLVILNNTVILILEKTNITPEHLIESFSENIVGYKYGILQIISLEIQNILRKKGFFIDDKMLKVSKEALGYHKNKHSDEFEMFIKNIFIEQENLKISNEEISFLKEIEKKEYDDNLKEEYINLNIFYNSSHTEKEGKNLSFGDVFKCKVKVIKENGCSEEKEHYFMCITPVCDCAHPENRRNQFFFVRGKHITKTNALELGETGFISYLPLDTVQWGEDLKEKEPTYIVPEVYLVQNSIINNNILKVTTFHSNNTIDYDFEYITTIKQNYAQRIANHAFMHPIRVGVDFVTKK